MRSRSAAVALAVVLGFLGAAAIAAENAEPKPALGPDVKAFVSRWQATCDRAKTECESRLETLKKDRRKGGKSGMARTAKAIKAHEERLKEIKAGGYMPLVNPHELAADSLGILRFPIEVRQILGPQEFLGAPVNGKEPFLARGLDTAGLADGKQILPKLPFMAEGTTSYKTVLGAAKTVYVVRFVDVKTAAESLPPKTPADAPAKSSRR